MKLLNINFLTEDFLALVVALSAFRAVKEEIVGV